MRKLTTDGGMILLLAGLILPAMHAAHAQASEPALEVSSTEFRPDAEFPDLLPHIIDGYELKYAMRPVVPSYDQLVRRGATVRVHLTNGGGESLAISGIHLDGIDLGDHLQPIHRENQGIRAASYLLNDEATTPEETKRRLDELGAPVWFRVRPNPIPPGATAEAIIRFRTIPDLPEIPISINTERDGELDVAVAATPPPVRIASVSFNAAIDRLTVYLRSTEGGDFEIDPAATRLDGKAAALEPGEPSRSEQGNLPIELSLGEGWDHGTLHSIRIDTSLGRAETMLRARDDFFAMGMWGYRNYGNTDEERALDSFGAFHDHLFNTHMGMGHADFTGSESGLAWIVDHGMRVMRRDPVRSDAGHPGLYARFLMDEPDAHEWAVQDLPDSLRLGAYAQGLVERQRHWTDADPRTLSLLNVNLTYKPENWLMYGALPDIFSCDPYYQSRLQDAYNRHPGWLAQFSRPYYVFAISEVARFGSEPAPLHIILNSVEHQEAVGYFRYGTPEEKRIEWAYAIAAGAKGISYWWFTPYGRYRGAGSDDPAAKAMMAEMRRLNLETRCLLPLLAQSHPANPPGSRTDPFVSVLPAWLMGRSLLVGTHSLLVVLINRDHGSDRVGTLYEPVAKSVIEVTVPTWLDAREGIRLTRDGIESFDLPELDAATRRMTLEFRDHQLTEYLVLTERTGTREAMQSIWERLDDSQPLE